VLGTQYDRSSFWHLVYGVSSANWQPTADTANARYAGHLDVTDQEYLPSGALDPWNARPTYLNDLTTYVDAFQ